jgi:hypothetical protein
MLTQLWDAVNEAEPTGVCSTVLCMGKRLSGTSARRQLCMSSKAHSSSNVAATCSHKRTSLCLCGDEAEPAIACCVFGSSWQLLWLDEVMWLG